MNNILCFLVSVVILLMFKLTGVYKEGFSVSPSGRSFHKLDHIIDNIYLGNWRDSINYQKLKENNIKCILTLNKRRKHKARDVEMFQELGIKQKYISINDHPSENILAAIDESLPFINSCQGNVFVHCTAGVSRSASVVLAYLVTKKGMLLGDAFSYLKEKRQVINPNSGFIKQLSDRYM